MECGSDGDGNGDDDDDDDGSMWIHETAVESITLKAVVFAKHEMCSPTYVYNQ